MNSKEALKRIYNDAISLNDIEEDVEEIKNDYDLIKQDLDKLEQLKKALDILKRFHFQLNQTRHNSTGYEMWIDSLLETEELTKEEYELLEEVLGND